MDNRSKVIQPLVQAAERGTIACPRSGKQALGDPDMEVPLPTRQLGDVELAYLVSEIFQNLGDGVACVLPPPVNRSQAISRLLALQAGAGSLKVTD